jgi:hypothetical protein
MKGRAQLRRIRPNPGVSPTIGVFALAQMYPRLRRSRSNPSGYPPPLAYVVALTQV